MYIISIIYVPIYVLEITIINNTCTYINYNTVNKAIVDIRLCPWCALALLTLYISLTISPINAKLTSLSYVHQYSFFRNVYRYHSNSENVVLRFRNSSH